jgi:hypothetical protein
MSPASLEVRAVECRTEQYSVKFPDSISRFICIETRSYVTAKNESHPPVTDIDPTYLHAVGY